jgi:ATP-binding cassette subfamily C protein
MTVLRDIVRRMPGRSAILLLLMIVNGFTEGLSMALIFPLLTTVGIGGGEASSSVMRVFVKAFAALNLTVTVGSVVSVIVVVVVVQSAVFLAQSWLGAKLQAAYVFDWRYRLMSSIFKAKWQFFVAQRQGDLLHTLMSDTVQAGNVFSILIQIATAALVALIFTAYAMLVSWQATTGLVVAAGIIMTAGIPVLRRGGKVGATMVHYSAGMQSMATEFIGGAKLIKATATEDEASQAFATGMTSWLSAYFWSRFQPGILRVTIEGLGIISLCVFFWIGAGVFEFEIAAMLVVFALFVRLYPKLSSVQQNIHTLNISLPAVDRVRRLVLDAQASAEPVSALPLPEEIRKGSIGLKLRDMAAGYGETPVLHSISLDVEPGETVAIVGRSGAGKSTLVDCLLQLVDISHGDILVNGTAVADLPLASWRASVGYVSQETFLFNTSVLDNILWSSEGHSPAEAEEAAKLAGAHDFITGFPDGYQTLVGDRGVRLSGGQRQRIGLARALVARRRLLILDEATSALDSQTEQEVMQTIYDLRGRITMVIIAHRLSTVRNADRIYVLDQGKVVESGTWPELLERDGQLAHMWRLQNTAGAETEEDKLAPVQGHA